MTVDNRTAQILKEDLMYILGYMTAKEELENSPFEGTECHTIRQCLRLIEQERRKENKKGVSNDNTIEGR